MGIIKNIWAKVCQMIGAGGAGQDKPQYKEDYADPMSITAVVANKVATLTMLDSDATIKGDNERARYMGQLLKRFIAYKEPTAAEVALGTGDVLIKPYTDGRYIGVDIIPNENFYIAESVDDCIKSCIIKCEEKTDYITGDKYERFEVQQLHETTLEGGTDKTYVEIKNLAFKNGKPLALGSVPAWANIKPSLIIPNAKSLLFGRYKCPTVNRENINSPHGVKITYGLDSVMAEAGDAMRRFNDEFERKEALIFYDKTLFGVDSAGRPIAPSGGQYRKINNYNADNGDLIKEYSPTIRANDFEKGIDTNLKIIELFAGLSSGVLTSPTTKFATATEIKASLQATYAFITKFRKTIEQGTRDFLTAVDVLLNALEIVPMGEYDVIFDWSSSYIEQMEEQANRLLQGEAIGAIDKAEYRAYTMDESYEEAKKRVKEIEEENRKSGEF